MGITRPVREFLRNYSLYTSEFLQVTIVRYAVGLGRYHLFRRRPGGTRTARGSGAVAENTVTHNLKGVSGFGIGRPNKLIRPLSVIESLGRDSRILAIGPRNEGELLSLVGHGFRARNIRGLDLISYSPWVDLGDMHAMPYADSSWDVVLAGWVFAYSTDRHRAAEEVMRVIKPGGVVALSFEYRPDSNDQVIAECGYLPGAAERVTSVAELLALFEGHVDHVYFSHDVIPERAHEAGTVSAIFSTHK